MDGPRAWDADITVRFVVQGQDPVTLRLHNGVLIHATGTGSATAEPQVEFTLAEPDLRALLVGALPPADLAARDGVEIAGDAGKLTELLGHLGEPDPDFAVVTP